MVDQISADEIWGVVRGKLNALIAKYGIEGLALLDSAGTAVDARTTKFYDNKEVVWEWPDPNGRSPIIITIDGTVYIAKSNITVDTSALQARIAAVEALLPSKNITCWGDSLTAATFPTRLAALLSGRTVTNKGIGGQWDNQIAQRQGGAVPLVTISGNQIVSGANTITHFNGVAVASMASSPGADQLYSTASGNGTTTGKARISGILGTVSRSATGGPPSTAETYTFTPDSGQTLPVRCPALSPMIVDVGTSDKETVVLWPGRNGNWAAPAAIVTNIRKMVARLATAEKRFVIMTIINGNYATEVIGQTRYDQLNALNAMILQEWPNNTIDIRRGLIERGLAYAGITPTAQDSTDIANDTVPASLRSDNVHLTTTTNGGYDFVASEVAAFITAKGW